MQPILTADIHQLDQLWQASNQQTLGAVWISGDGNLATMETVESDKWDHLKIAITTGNVNRAKAQASAGFIHKFWNLWPMIRQALAPDQPLPNTALHAALREVVNRFGADASTGIPDTVLASVLEHQLRLAGGLKRALTVPEMQGLPESSQVPHGCRMVAVHTGDGWALEIHDQTDQVVATLAWPPQWPASMTEDQLRVFGLEVE